MNRYILTSRGAAVALSLAAVMSAPGITLAGPGCMNDQRVSRDYYPYSPMPPQAGYRAVRPYGYYVPPAPAGWMTAPYYRPVIARTQNTAVSSKPAAVARPESTPLVPVSNTSQAGAETVTVRINGMRFEPANLTVKPGTTVNWVQGDRMPHTITGKGNGLRSNTLQMSQNYSYTFKEAGNYDYACDFHPSMKGLVVVEESGIGS